VDHPTDVVRGDDVAHVDLTGVEIDVDAHDTRCPAEGRIGIAAIGLVVEAGTRVRLEALVDPQPAVLPGELAVRPGERAAGRHLDAGPKPPCGLDEQPADDHRRPRRDRGTGIGDECRVLRRELDRLDGHGECLGHQLREDRLGPLPHLGGSGQDLDSPVGLQLDRGDRRELDLARAREPRAMPCERDPDATRRAIALRPKR